MDELRSFFREKKNLINLIILSVLALAMPLAVNLVRQQQILRSRAATDPIVFTGANVEVRAGRQVLKLNEEGKAVVGLLLTSRLGAPGVGTNQSLITPPPPGGGTPPPPAAGAPPPPPSGDQSDGGTTLPPPPPQASSCSAPLDCASPEYRRDPNTGQLPGPCIHLDTLDVPPTQYTHGSGGILARFVSCPGAGGYAGEVRNYLNVIGYSCWLNKQVCGETFFVP